MARRGRVSLPSLSPPSCSCLYLRSPQDWGLGGLFRASLQELRHFPFFSPFFDQPKGHETTARKEQTVNDHMQPRRLPKDQTANRRNSADQRKCGRPHDRPSVAASELAPLKSLPQPFYSLWVRERITIASVEQENPKKVRQNAWATADPRESGGECQWENRNRSSQAYRGAMNTSRPTQTRNPLTP